MYYLDETFLFFEKKEPTPYEFTISKAFLFLNHYIFFFIIRKPDFLKTFSWRSFYPKTKENSHFRNFSQRHFVGFTFYFLKFKKLFCIA